MPPLVPATVKASVPVVVTGVPATEIKPPVNVWATLVTVPPAAQLAVVPLLFRYRPWVPIARLETVFAPLPSNRLPVVQPEGMANVRVPEVVTGLLVTVNPVGAARPTEVVVPPAPPPPHPACPLSTRFPAASMLTQ